MLTDIMKLLLKKKATLLSATNAMSEWLNRLVERTTQELTWQIIKIINDIRK